MPYTSPATQTAGAIATAAYANSLKTALDWLANPPACSLNRTTDQTIATSADAAIQFNAAEDYDTASMHDLVTNNTRATAPATGIYACHFEATFNSSGTAMMVKIRANGSTIWHFVREDTSGTVRLAVAGDVKLVAGGYVEGVVFQLTGGNVIVSNATMQVRYVGLG